MADLTTETTETTVGQGRAGRRRPFFLPLISGYLLLLGMAPFAMAAIYGLLPAPGVPREIQIAALGLFAALAVAAAIALFMRKRSAAILVAGVIAGDLLLRWSQSTTVDAATRSSIQQHALAECIPVALGLLYAIRLWRTVA